MVMGSIQNVQISHFNPVNPLPDPKILGQKAAMLLVTVAYFIATTVIGVSQLFSMETIWPGLSFLLGGTFAFWAGSSLKLAVFAPLPRLRWIGFLMTAFFAVIGTLATLSTGTHFDAYGHDMPGFAWVMAGVIAGIMGTKRRVYLSTPEAVEK